MVHNGTVLQKAYLRVKNFLFVNGIAFIPATAGMFLFAQLCTNAEAQTENEFEETIKSSWSLAQCRDKLPLPIQSQAWFRICYAVEGSVYSEGLQRLNDCLGPGRDEILPLMKNTRESNAKNC